MEPFRNWHTGEEERDKAMTGERWLMRKALDSWYLLYPVISRVNHMYYWLLPLRNRFRAWGKRGFIILLLPTNIIGAFFEKDETLPPVKNGGVQSRALIQHWIVFSYINYIYSLFFKILYSMNIFYIFLNSKILCNKLDISNYILLPTMI